MRPNLKGFVIGGLMVLGFHYVLQQVETAVIGHARRPTVPPLIQDWTDSHYRSVLHYSVDHPSAEVFYKLSNYLERQRDYRKARVFLKKAEAMSIMGEDSD
ncbi:MAG: hypothetical protein FJ405_17655 [Verrucomicrobia bacterium]|nr:hypothetical protein [Verrucomicrobiota bacterium]